MPMMDYVGDELEELLGHMTDAVGDDGIVETIGAVHPKLARSMKKVTRVIESGGRIGRPAYYALPMTGGGSIAAAAVFTLTGQPSKPVKPKRLVLSASLVGGSVSSFSIATIPQFLSTTAGAACPIEAFDSRAIDQGWEFAVLDPSQTSVVTGVNNNAAASNIFGCLEGYTTKN
jgi:hypothetical protein